jgi:nucleotide-binding universal stress UspA family protein
MHALDYLHTDYADCSERSEWWLESTYDIALRYLHHVAARVLEAWRMHADITLIEADAPSVLLHSAEARHADLTVMTSHGRGPVERFWLGSVADQVIREAGHPVLIVPASSDPQAVRDDRPFTHVLVPLDGSQVAEGVLHHAAHLASNDGARVSLVTVTHAPLVHALSYEAGSYNMDAEVDAHRYLTDRCHTLGWMAHDVTCASLNGVSPVGTQIVDYARTHDVDIIALSAHGHGGLHRLLLGSVADKIIRASPVPVLVVKNPEGNTDFRS